MDSKNGSKKRRFPARFWLTLIVILILIPAVILISGRIGGRTYYAAAVLVIILTLVSFYLVLEYRKPQAREIVVLAVLCALAVASRAVFYAIPNFKPMTGIVMISAISFGPVAGFLVGSISGFASNFMFGQGPWTPWQMFAYGIAGFITGVLNWAGILPRKRIPLSVCGFLLIVVIVGPILDSYALFSISSMQEVPFVWSVYLSGIPVNLIHGAATFLTLFFFEKPLTEKLDRIKLKYGMMEGNQDEV